MDASERRVEIFAPFGEAFELTTKILFRPFDLKKWFVIGFAAFLATFFSGNFGFQQRFSGKDWNWKTQEYGPHFSWHNAPPWFVPLLIGVLLVVCAFIVLLAWLNSRGRFMFTDCIARNRGAIAEPWREYRTEGNRLFVFQVVFTFCNMIVIGGLMVLFFLDLYWKRHLVPLPVLILGGVVYFLIVLVIALILRFLTPVMYRQRCGVMDAFRQVWELMLARPGVFILFALFYLLLFIATAMVGCLAACVTCCIAALPYLGTVILLPVVMFLFAYPLCFLRQFGDPYDVFAGGPASDAPPLLIPPVQTEPPPPQTGPPPIPPEQPPAL